MGDDGDSDFFVDREDPAVGPVEDILEAAHGARRSQSVLDGRTAATAAAWICACVSLDDAPTWLISKSGEDDGIVWCRVPDSERSDAVRARVMSSGHAVPAEVLKWLLGDAATPWAEPGSGWGDDAALRDIYDAIHRR